MSQHSYITGRERQLSPAEHALLEALIRASKIEQLLPQLGSALVQDMNDGGMGSLRFAGAEARKFGGKVAEAEFKDEDGMLVMAALHVDLSGNLFELDMFKGDFKPLISIPAVESMSIRKV